jgi:hypothetical protein
MALKPRRGRTISHGRAELAEEFPLGSAQKGSTLGPDAEIRMSTPHSEHRRMELFRRLSDGSASGRYSHAARARQDADDAGAYVERSASR